MKKSAFFAVIAFIAVGCTTEKQQLLMQEVQDKPVAAELTKKGESNVLKGPSVFQLDDHFVWGASPIKGEDNRYYIVYSAFEQGKHPFTTAWVTGSKLGLAVSDKPDRDFEPLGFFYNTDGYAEDQHRWDAQSVQNPHLRKFGDKYYLYYVGTVDPGTKQVKSTENTLDRRNRIQQVQKIGVIEFNSFKQLLAGDFKEGNLLLEARTRVKSDNIVAPSAEGVKALPDNVIVVNPSVVYRPADGKYLLYFKGNIYDPSWRGVHGVALGDSPTGPFVAQDFEVFSLKSVDGKKLSAEDPYVWYNKTDKLFYAVFKDFTGHFTKSGPSLAWMKSKDGIVWDLPKHSLFQKREVTLLSGEVLKVDRLERPQLLLDDEGNPQVLFAACSVDNVNPKSDGSSFNIHIPLRIKYGK